MEVQRTNKTILLDRTDALDVSRGRFDVFCSLRGGGLLAGGFDRRGRVGCRSAICSALPFFLDSARGFSFSTMEAVWLEVEMDAVSGMVVRMIGLLSAGCCASSETTSSEGCV